MKWVRCVVLIKDDGIYMHDLAAQSDTRVWPLTKATIGLKMALSPDRKSLILSQPTSERAVLYFDIDWANKKLTLKESIDTDSTRVLWPVFSPDGKYVAFQAIETSTEGPRLIIQDLETNTFVKSVSLKGFNYSISFLTDWIY